MKVKCLECGDEFQVTIKLYDTSKSIRWCPLIKGWITTDRCSYCQYSRDTTAGKECLYPDDKEVK